MAVALVFDTSGSKFESWVGSMEYTYKITTDFATPTFWKGRKRTVHGTLNRAVLIWKANHLINEVTVERAPIGEYETFDMEEYIETSKFRANKQ